MLFNLGQDIRSVIHAVVSREFLAYYFKNFTKQWTIRSAFSRAHIPPHRPWSLTLIFLNLITSYPVAKGLTYKALNDLAPPPHLSSAFTMLTTCRLDVDFARSPPASCWCRPIGRFRSLTHVSGTVFSLMLRLLRRWPSSNGAWRQNFFAAATMLLDCYFIYSYSGPWNGLSI